MGSIEGAKAEEYVGCVVRAREMVRASRSVRCSSSGTRSSSRNGPAPLRLAWYAPGVVPVDT